MIIMKKVIEIVDRKTLEIREVPDDYIHCSVSGEWHPPESFKEDFEPNQSRANCKWTYSSLSFDSMRTMKEETTKILASDNYRKLERSIRNERVAFDSSMPIQEMIEILQELQFIDPNARVAITQDGYYADGKFAWVYDEPEKVSEHIYSIGHSSQNY
jgi:hypothetical protein